VTVVAKERGKREQRELLSDRCSKGKGEKGTEKAAQ